MIDRKKVGLAWLWFTDTYLNKVIFTYVREGNTVWLTFGSTGLDSIALLILWISNRFTSLVYTKDFGSRLKPHLTKISHSRPLFSTQKLLITGFEPRISGVRSDRSPSCVAQNILLVTWLSEVSKIGFDIYSCPTFVVQWYYVVIEQCDQKKIAKCL